MTIENLVEMLQEMKIPFAYDHFAEGKVPSRHLSVISCLAVITLLLMERCISR